MQRGVQVSVDAGSWGSKPVPPELSKSAGDRQVDVLLALIYTAMVTRPPIVHGFHLSDIWAWLRYLPAIGDSRDLRLRPEWQDVDRHQKNLLSDELGVGFTSQFVGEVLGCWDFTDALYVINVLKPKRFSLKGGKKTGPKKSPDYIARSPKSQYVVLECKGTQSSREYLNRTIEDGKKQKKNLKVSKPTSISHSLVAGLFIPQWSNSEKACIRIADPDREDFEEILSEHPREHIDDAITQISLAKQFALAGLTAVPTYLASTARRDLGVRPDAVTTEIRNRIDMRTDDYRTVFESAERLIQPPQNRREARVRFSVRTPVAVLDHLMGNVPIHDIISGLTMRSSESPWKRHSSEVDAEIATPLGFAFRLDQEPGGP